MAQRIFDFRPADENALIERVLVYVHKSVDQFLSAADGAPKRYSKTLFSEEESTGLVKAAIDHDRDPERATPRIPLPGPQNPGVKVATGTAGAPSQVSTNPIDRTPAKTGVPQQTSGTQPFSTSFDYTQPKMSGGGKDLFLILMGIIILTGMAVGYWYLFEAGQP